MGNTSSMLGSFYSQSFRIAAPPLTEKNLPDQTGKVFLITGGYAGVGTHVSRILYSHNATVYIAGRSESKAQKTIDQIKSEVPNSNGKLVFLNVDLSDLTTIKHAAEEFMSKESKLHWLDNNAGVMVPPKNSKGAQGMDLQYQTNILGPFLFTKLLLPVLRRTAETEAKGSVRVSWAGSLAVDLQSPTGGVAFKDGTLAHGMTDPATAYGTTKAANYLLGYEFGQRFGNKDGVLHNSYNPGNLKTELQRHAEVSFGKVASWMIDRIVYPAVFGAYTELYSGLSKDLTIEQDQGGYLVPWGRKSGVRKDVEEARGEGKNSEKLYEWCEKETSKYA